MSELGLWVHNAKCSNNKSKRPDGYKENDIDKHGNLSVQKNRALGHENKKSDNFVQSHHIIQDNWAKKWAKENNKNYKRNDAPAILLKSNSGSPHALISSMQRERRKNEGYNTDIKYEFNKSYKEMIDAGVDEKYAKKAIRTSYKYFDRIGGFEK